MSEQRHPHVIEQTERNIDLAFQLLDDAIDDDEVLDAIPDGGTLVLLPYDSPTLTLRNLAMASRLAVAGTTVYLRRVGAPPDGGSGLDFGRVAAKAIRWAIPVDLGDRLMMEKNPIADTVVFDFTGAGRERNLYPVGTGISLLVDLSSLDAVGYSISASLVSHIEAMWSETTHESSPVDNGHRRDTVEVLATFFENLAAAAA